MSGLVKYKWVVGGKSDLISRLVLWKNYLLESFGSFLQLDLERGLVQVLFDQLFLVATLKTFLFVTDPESILQNKYGRNCCHIVKSKKCLSLSVTSTFYPSLKFKVCEAYPKSRVLQEAPLGQAANITLGLRTRSNP